ncbi:MAG: system mannose-specific component [Firmicutes bacterium]|nr:system mannose-specific component [Bacillota bacterium]
MKIVLVRVDDRLIHGQVVVGWTRTVGANHIVVANDEVANNSMQRTLLKMAAPAGVKVSILPVAEAGAQLAAQKFSGDNVLLLVRDPRSLMGLLEAGVQLGKVNVGNCRAAEGKKRLTKEVHASPEDMVAWKELDAAGVVLEAQWLPDQPRTDLNRVIKGEA